MKKPHRPHVRSQSGVALLMVITTITILSMTLMDFTVQSNQHLNASVNIRDEVKANVLADTALVMSRACLDKKAWGALGAMQSKVDLQKICNLLLGVFIKNQVDLPTGGVSVPLEGISGLGIDAGEIEEIEMIPESTFIGLVGLACPPPNMMNPQVNGGMGPNGMPMGANNGVAGVAGVAGVGGMGAMGANGMVPFDPLNCASRVSTAKKLRALLCDPDIAHIFESEQGDGEKYTREDIVGNLIDWIDPDNNRVSIDPLTWTMQEGAGESEDSYYRDGDDRYRSKDSMFDSIEELKLVRGINDELFEFLKDKVSVHATDMININTASAEVIGTLIQAYSNTFQMMESNVCGEESPNPNMNRMLFKNYARMVVDARSAIQFNRMMTGNFLGTTFRNGQEFISVAQDPFTTIAGGMMGGMGGMGGMMDPQMMMMMRYQLDPMQYQLIQQGTAWPEMVKSLGTNTELYRLKVRAKIGDMTRDMYAILKQDGNFVRTLYYREN